MIYVPPRGQPSKHFTWAEVIRNSGYTRVPLGPMRLPNGSWVTPRANARMQAHKLEVVRATINVLRADHGLNLTGLHILSWARSWEHNKAVGGAKDSQHLYFRACDISLQEIERLCPWGGGRQDFERIIQQVYWKGGVGDYAAGNRHVDCRGYRARWTSYVGW
jgi:uncharacterized protein YcbK (DUF882 family)